MSTEQSATEARYEISIEGRIHPWDKESISTAEVRELGGFPADCPVVAVHFTEGKEEPMSEDAVHDVPPREMGKPLVKRVNFKRGS